MQHRALTLLTLLAGCDFVPGKDAVIDPDGDGVPWPDDCDNDDPEVTTGCGGEGGEEGGGDGEDADGDGSPAGGDCDDGDAATAPGAEETCGDGVVNDCAGTAAEALADCGLPADRSLSEADAVFLGDEPYEYAGYAVSAAGDLNADGRADVAIGAPYGESAAVGAGDIYVVYGSPSGEVDLAEADAVLSGGTPSGNAGSALCGPGDIDGDGQPDLPVGVPALSVDEEETGGFWWVVAPVETGVLEYESAAGWTGADTYSLTGLGLAAADPDGDGAFLLAVGAPGYEGGDSPGAVFLWVGPEPVDGAISDPDGLLVGRIGGDRVGMALAVGDVDGTGVEDLLVGAPGGVSKEIWNGGAYLAQDAAWMSVDLADSSAIIEGTGGETAGFSVALADLDGDGADDLVLGAPNGGDGGTWEGRVYVWNEPPEGAASTLSADAELTGQNDGDRTGRSVAPAGDADGDGRADLLIGALDHDGAGESSGAAWLVLGPIEADLALGQAALRAVGPAAGDQAGIAVAGAGDTDTDGYDDLLVGGWLHDAGGDDAGATWLVRGGGY